MVLRQLPGTIAVWCKLGCTFATRSLARISIVVTWGMLNSSTFQAAAGNVEFKGKCSDGERLVVAAVGDLLFQRPLQKQALASGGSYRAIWRPVEHLLRSADLVYGNLEGTVAAGLTHDGKEIADPGRMLDHRVYDAPQAWLSFNYHQSLLNDLKLGGFDIVSTANNHALDRGAPGIDRTISAIEAVSLAFTGTRKRGETDRPWSVVTRAHGFAVAWLACTYGTNSRTDFHGQVLRCFEQSEAVLGEIKRLGSSKDVDAVILVPHWGIEGYTVIEQRQRELARDAIAAGAIAVIGTHPHVLQEWEKVTEGDHEGLVVYSTGNFVSSQRRYIERTGMVVYIELVRSARGDKARIARAGYVLTRIVERPQFAVVASRPATLPRELPAGNQIVQTGLWRECPRSR